MGKLVCGCWLLVALGAADGGVNGNERDKRGGCWPGRRGRPGRGCAQNSTSSLTYSHTSIQSIATEANDCGGLCKVGRGCAEEIQESIRPAGGSQRDQGRPCRDGDAPL